MMWPIISSSEIIHTTQPYMYEMVWHYNSDPTEIQYNTVIMYDKDGHETL